MKGLSLIRRKEEAPASEPPDQPPHRVALAAAIVEAAQIEKGAEAARKAVARAREMVQHAADNFDRAAAAAVDAQRERTARLVAAASSGEAAIPDQNTRTTRLAELDAQDQLDAARAALSTLEAALEEPEYQAGRAMKRVAEQADAVIAAEAEAALAAAHEAQRAHAVAAMHVSAVAASMPHSADPFYQRVRNYPTPFFPDDHRYDQAREARKAVDAAWREAREALMRDAAAPLPTIGGR